MMDDAILNAERLILTDCRVMDPSGERLVARDIVVEGNRIVEVREPRGGAAGERVLDAAGLLGETVLDASGLLAIPGMINAHTHTHNNLLKGTTDCVPLELYINTLGSRLAGWSPRDYYLSAMVGAIEMLKSGSTAAYDMVSIAGGPNEEALGAVVQAYTDVGLRVTLAPAIADLPFTAGIPGLHDRLPAEVRARAEERLQPPPMGQSLSLAEAAIARWNGSAEGRVRLAVGPIIPGQCTDAFLQGCADLSRRMGVGLHTHCLESKVQAIHARETYGATLIEHLAELGVLGPNTTLAHGVWLTEEDAGLVARAGASIAHNPASNLKIGSGIAAVREYLDAGVNVALGTDGSASTDNQNMFGALWLAALVSHVRSPDPSRWLTAAEVFRMATFGSARALGLEDELGALEPGRLADIVLLDLSSVYLRPLNNPLLQLVYAEIGSAVHTVLVDGRVVVSNGRLTTLDEYVLLAEAQAAVDRHGGGSQQARELAAAIEPHLAELHLELAGRPYPVNRFADGR